MSIDNKPERLYFAEGWLKTKNLYLKRDKVDLEINDNQTNYWFMDTMEDIVKDVYILLGIKNRLTVHRGKAIKMYKYFAMNHYNSVNSHFHLDICNLKNLKKILTFKNFSKNNQHIYENLYTYVAHEFVYILNEDLVYFGLSENYSREVNMKALDTLKDIRADLTTKKLLVENKKKYRFDWVGGSKNYHKTGILEKETRLDVINCFDNYEDNIDLIIDKYLVENKKDLIDFVKKEFEGNQLKYFLKLLGV